MADGDVLVDEEVTFPDGTRMTLFAVESSEYPGGVNYRFAYYDPETGDDLLRYDNATIRTHGAGFHHRHTPEEVHEIEFHGLHNHLERFTTEVSDSHE